MWTGFVCWTELLHSKLQRRVDILERRVDVLERRVDVLERCVDVPDLRVDVLRRRWMYWGGVGCTGAACVFTRSACGCTGAAC